MAIHGLSLYHTWIIPYIYIYIIPPNGEMVCKLFILDGILLSLEDWFDWFKFQRLKDFSLNRLQASLSEQHELLYILLSNNFSSVDWDVTRTTLLPLINETSFNNRSNISRIQWKTDGFYTRQV